RTHPGGDEGARRGTGCLSPGQAAGEPAGASHGTGRAGGAPRPAPPRGETPPPDRRRGWHGGALAAVARHCRRARGDAPASPDLFAERRVSLRDAPVPRARIYL